MKKLKELEQKFICSICIKKPSGKDKKLHQNNSVTLKYEKTMEFYYNLKKCSFIGICTKSKLLCFIFLVETKNYLNIQSTRLISRTKQRHWNKMSNNSPTFEFVLKTDARSLLNPSSPVKTKSYPKSQVKMSEKI